MPGAGRASADRSLWLRSTYSGYPDGQASPDWHASLMRMRCLLVDDNAAFLSSARTLLDRQGVLGHLTGRGARPRAVDSWRTAGVG